MEDNIIFKLNNKIYSNNNDILLDVISKLENIINDSKSDINIKRIKDIIIILNNIIEQNKKNTKEIINYIAKLDKNINNNFKEIKDIIINEKNKKRKKKDFSKFVDQKTSDKRKRKKNLNFKNPNRYEDDFKNDKRRGKGISGLNSSFEYPRKLRFRGPGYMESIEIHVSMGQPGPIQQGYEPLGFGGEFIPKRSHRFKSLHGSYDQYMGYGRSKKQRTSSFDIPSRYDGPLRTIPYEYGVIY